MGDWPDQAAERLWHGEGRRFIGLARRLERISAKAEGEELAWLEERLDDAPCPSCDGARLRPESLAVELGGASIAEVGECAVVAATEWLSNLDFPTAVAPVGEAIRSQISRRLNLLQELGLEYLQLNRRADTLSSGEFQRLRLGSALSSGTTQMLYVLDEPSAGLHARDAAQLLDALRITARRWKFRVPNRTRRLTIAWSRLAGRYGAGRGDCRRAGRSRGHAK